MAGHARRRCGAWARSKGRPCIAAGTGAGGRCFIHGGKLPSPEARKRITEASCAYWAAYRERLGVPAWWRCRLVGMSAAAWLAKQRAQADGEPCTKTPTEIASAKP